MTKPAEPRPASRPEKPPQTIGGGYIVLRRHHRLRHLKAPRGGMPFEHPTFEAAFAQAEALADRIGGEFGVFAQVETVTAPIPVTPAEVPVAAPAAEPAPEPAERRGRRVLSLPKKLNA